MRVSRPGGEPSGLLIGAGVKILGVSLERRRPTPAALPLIADGNSVVWTARLLCKNPLNSWPLACYRRREEKELHENHASASFLGRQRNSSVS
jgi:hypothetical protein